MQLYQSGVPYAGLVAKIFGFKATPNRRALLHRFTEERASYQNYYQREKEKGVIEEKHVQGLNIVKVHIYIKQITPESDSMGQTMWRCLIKALYSRQLEAMNMKPVDGVYSADDVPFPRDGDRDEVGSFENTDRADEELSPSQRDKLEKLKAKVAPSTVKDFAVVAFSLLSQSHYKVMEIQLIVKSYDQ